ncbi:MAG: ABC transporter permease [Gammaproteobacteria bacterium]
MRLFCIAVAVACAVTFSITLLGDRLEQLFNSQAKEVIAADLVLQSSTELSDEQKEIVDSFSLRTATTLTFQTMANANADNNESESDNKASSNQARVNQEEFLLSSVKAVSNAYPLLGELQVSNQLYGEPQATQSVPKKGEVWVEDRVLNELGLTLNQRVNIGEASFKITSILVYEPDRGNSFYSFTPRIMMNWEDVAATKIVRPGSRVKFRYLFAGIDSKLNNLLQTLEPSLQLNQEFITIDSANQTLANTLNRAYRFLHITALIAVLLGAVAAALVSYQYANEMTYQYALLRCLGLQGKRMVAAVAIPFLVFSLIAVIIGLMMGGIAHIFILRSLGDLIPEALPAASIKPYLLSAFTALVVVTSFAWPFLKKLLKTAPKLLLNRIETQQQPIIFTVVAMLLGLSVIVFIGTQELMISVYIIAVLFVFVLLAYFVTRYFINWYSKYSQSKGVSTKLTARSLQANRRMVIVQVVAISITFFSLALISTIRDDLVASWQSKVPDNAPNIFVINLFENEKKSFLDKVKGQGLEHSPLYPVVRGRLSAINDLPIREYASKETERQDESLGRDLALTWNMQLPKDNEIIRGNWHAVDQAKNTATVSVEEGLAENLEITLGDKLSFTVETQVVEAVVTSVRSVEWESFTPNFYMIFYPGVLDGLPVSYMGSLHLDKQQRPVLRDFVKQFPSATFFDVDFLLNRIRGIAQKISYAVETVLYFALFASLLVFISIEMILRKNRSYSTAIFKAVGADTKLVQKVFRTQFLLIGLIAGMIAYLLNLVISFALSNYLIEGQFVFNPKTAILCLILAPLLVLIAGYVSIQRTKQIPVKKLLAES